MGTLFTENPAPENGLLDIGLFDRLRSGGVFGIATENSLDTGDIAYLSRGADLANEEPRIYGGRGSYIGTLNPTPLLDPDTANERYGIPGQLTFDKPVREGAAKKLREFKKAEIERNDRMMRADRSIPGAAFAGAMLGTVLDPISLASMFVPGIGEARFAAIAGRYGLTAARVARGVSEGVAGSLITEPILLAEAHRQHADYDFRDSLLNLTLGGVLGGGLHVALGRLGDRISGTAMKPREIESLIDEVRIASKDLGLPRSAYREQLMGASSLVDSISPERRMAYLQGALGSMVEGRPVDVGDLVAMEAKGRFTFFVTARKAEAGGAKQAPDILTPQVERSADSGQSVVLRKDGTPSIYEDRPAAEKWAASLNKRGDAVRVVPTEDGQYAIVRQKGLTPVLAGFKTVRAATKAIKSFPALKGRDLAVVPHDGPEGRTFAIVENASPEEIASATSRPDLHQFTAPEAERPPTRVVDRESFEAGMRDYLSRRGLIHIEPEDAAGIVEADQITARAGESARPTAGEGAESPEVTGLNEEISRIEADLRAREAFEDVGDLAELKAADEDIALAKAKETARANLAQCMIGGGL